MKKYLIFQGIRKVIAAERICQACGADYAVCAVPSWLSSECGMCIELHDQLENVTRQLRQESLEFTLYDSLTPKL